MYSYNGTPCWIWQGSITSAGYGEFKADGRQGARKTSPHRFIYAYTYGAIPHDKEIDHLCNNKKCCNPAHLDLVSHQENQARRSRRMMMCKRGHLRNQANVREYGNRRICRPCAAEAASRYRQRQQIKEK